MKYSAKQILKISFALTTLLISSILVFNQKMLAKEVAILTKEKNDELTQIKYSKGSQIRSVSCNDGDNSYEDNIIKNNTNQFFYNKISIDLKDKAVPNSVEVIDTKVMEDNMIINFEKPKDNGTSYNYYISNKGKEKKLEMYAKSDIKGYSYIIDNTEENEADNQINKLDNEPILEQKLDWNKNYYLHIKSCDNENNFSSNKTFKLELPSEGVGVKYIDTNTKSEIDVEEIISGYANQEYEVKSKQIDGYQLVNTIGKESGVLKKEKTNIIYEYAKNATILVNYIDRLTGKKLKESRSISGVQGQLITINAEKIDGYTYEKSKTNVKMNDEYNVFNIYYNEIPKGTIIVKYLDIETNNEISDSNVIEGRVNSKYNTEERIIEGYRLKMIPDNKEGTINSGKNEVVYYYIKEDNKKISQNTKNIKEITYVDYDTKEIIGKETIELNNENISKIRIKQIEGYRIMNINDFNEDESIIDELIKSLESDSDFIQKEEDNKKIIIPKKIDSKVLSEYEIVMNCDDSDYIIYYKK